MTRSVEYEERLAFRVTPRDVEKIRQAATIEGTTVSAFVRRAVVQVADDVMVLSALDRELARFDAD